MNDADANFIAALVLYSLWLQTKHSGFLWLTAGFGLMAAIGAVLGLAARFT